MKDKTEIKIFVDDDESLKIFGELLSNKTSRDLIKFLMNKSTYKKKIANELEIPSALIEYHLKKLEKLDLIKITNKRLITGGILHKNYKINADGIFITFNSKEKVEEKGILKKIFRKGIKFALIGIVAITVWLTDISHIYEISDVYAVPYAVNLPSSESLELSLIVIIIGLIIDRITIFIKKRKRVRLSVVV